MLDVREHVTPAAFKPAPVRDSPLAPLGERQRSDGPCPLPCSPGGGGGASLYTNITTIWTIGVII